MSAVCSAESSLLFDAITYDAWALKGTYRAILKLATTLEMLFFLENWLTIRIHVPLVFVLWVSRRSIALGTFLPGEAYDWSGKRFPACNFLAPSCMWLRTMVPIGVRFFVYFLPNFSEKVMKHLHQGREGIAPWGSNNMTTINHLFVQLQTPPI